MKLVRIASRKSPLAMCQTEIVATVLRRLDPDINIEITGVTTSGDIRARSGITKADFTKELEQLLLTGEADLAVHSMKDVPVQLPPALEISAILNRADPRDALLSGCRGGFDELPLAAHVGTASLRRRCQLQVLRPDLRISNLRGNVGTRLRRLDEGQYDAIVLAVAGLERLELQHRISSKLSLEQMIPAIGQGAIGVETREDCQPWLRTLLQGIGAHDTWLCLHTERLVGRLLGADCRLPVAAHAKLHKGGISLRAMVGDLERATVIHAAARGDMQQSELCAQQVVASLRQQGADKILEKMRR